MKRIIIALMGLMAIIACTEKLPDGGNGTLAFSYNPEAIAGSEFVIQSEKISEDAKLFLGGQELDIMVMSSGIITTLPYTLGTFDLRLEQDGGAVPLGKLLIKVDVQVQTAIVRGNVLKLTCSGLADDFTLLLGDEELECTSSNGILTAVIDVEPGTYVLKLSQAGTDQILVEEFGVGVPMIMTGYALGIGSGAGFTANQEYIIVYEEGKPAMFRVSGIEYDISSDGGNYTFTSDTDSFTYTVENGRVKTLGIGAESFEWDYDAEGHLIRYRDTFKREGETRPYRWGWEDGNLVQGTWDKNMEWNDLKVVYGDKLLLNNVQVDYTMLGHINGTLGDNDRYLAAACLLGLSGTPSVNLPSHYASGTDEEGAVQTRPYKITYNEEGYPEYIKGGEIMTHKCTYTAK